MENDVSIFKLVTGEEIVCRVIGDSPSGIKITNPVILMQNPDNPAALSFGIWSPFSDMGEDGKDLTMELHHAGILGKLPLHPELVKQYRKQFSLIEIADPSILMG